MNRRQVLSSLLTAGLLAGAPLRQAMAKKSYIQKTRHQWLAIVSRAQYAVLFEEATEAPGSSPLNQEKRVGTFVCAACNQALFKSTTKYDSGTGWPSFFDALPAALDTKTDYKIGVPRTEYHCSNCGGHQGHIFKDGPQPTGLRYCNNGLALAFVPDGNKLPEVRQ
ncbi:MAG: peptide-methionine (R)-S-oxide reductase MsrB [Burkholderiaceae bacterium]